jgi:hypothetical protein
MDVYVFENMEKVGAILVRYSTFDTKSYFETMKSLYAQKYGTPEQMLELETISYKRYVYWTFKNGIIYLDEEKIVYIDSIFIAQLERQSRLYKEEKERTIEEESRERLLRNKEEEQRRLQMEQTEKAEKAANHKKAIDEI